MGQATRHINPAKRIIPGKSAELSIIIPAAGIGRRMKSKEPKALLRIDDKSIIERQLSILWETYPKSDIVVVVGYKAAEVRNRLKDYPVRFVYNPIHETTNVGFSIGLGVQACISPHCLIVYGDLIFNENAIKTITSGKSKLLIDVNNNINDDEVGLIIDEKQRVTNLSFGLPQKWAQIAYLEGSELDLFKNACYNDNNQRWFGYELLNEIINHNGTLEAHSVSSSLIFDVDTTQDLNKATLSIG